MAHHSYHGHSHGANPIITPAQATWHCLTTCGIDETVGAIIGVTTGLRVWATMPAASPLAPAFGFGFKICARDS